MHVHLQALPPDRPALVLPVSEPPLPSLTRTKESLLNELHASAVTEGVHLT